MIKSLELKWLLKAQVTIRQERLECGPNSKSILAVNCLDEHFPKSIPWTTSQLRVEMRIHLSLVVYNTYFQKKFSARGILLKQTVHGGCQLCCKLPCASS